MSDLDIYENPATLSTVEKVRSFRTEIDTPYKGERYIRFHSERLVLDGPDGNQVGAKPQPTVSRPFSAVAVEMITIADPVLGKSVTISLAGLATAITERYVKWYGEDKAAAEAAAAVQPNP